MKHVLSLCFSFVSHSNATDKLIERLTKPYSQNSFDLGVEFYFESCVCNTAANFIADSSHVLHSCCETNPKYCQAPKANTNRLFGQFCGIFHPS